jgi:hypothetical protein
VADADETVTDASFFTLFACRLFACALFSYKVLSNERKAVARLERCFVRYPRRTKNLSRSSILQEFTENNIVFISQAQIFATRYNGRAKHSRIAEAPEFTPSFLTNI